MQVLLVAEEDDVGHTVDRHSEDLFARLGCGGDLLHLGALGRNLFVTISTEEEGGAHSIPTATPKLHVLLPDFSILTKRHSLPVSCDTQRPLSAPWREEHRTEDCRGPRTEPEGSVEARLSFA